MNVQTLEERVAVQKELVLTRQALHDEAVALVADLRAIPKDDPAFRSAQRQLTDAIVAEDVTGNDVEDAQRALTQAYADGRRQILEEHRPQLAGDVQAVDKAFKALVAAITRLDTRREALIEALGGNTELVPIVSPLPYARDRQEYWRSAMSGEGLL